MNVTVDPSEANYKEPQGREYFRELETRLRALPSVVSVSQEFSLPMGYISSDNPITVEGHPAPAGQQPPLVSYDMVSPGYFNTLRIPLLRGRGFSDADSEKAPRVAIINQTMAKNLWPNEDPLGKRFLAGHSEGSDPAAKWTEVIGIAQDGKYQNVTETPQAYFYVPFAQDYQSLRTISVRTAGAPENLAQAVTEAIRSLDSNVPVTQLQTMHEALNSANGFFLFEFGAQLTATMGLLGLILASVGIYSVVSYAAAQRTQEIGIRMALGAEPRDILRMVLRQGLGVVGIGIAVGLLAAYLGARLVAGLLFNVSAADPLTYISVGAFLTGVALLACWIPARRATRVSPLTALRYE
ncbi:MAG: FtsX-like permease family protein [Candidatus Acidiferrales bacterium]